MSKNKHLAKGSDFLLSLSSIVGKKVVDIHGYVTGKFDMLNFKLVAVVFEDGTVEGIEGEHDCPYIPQPAKHIQLRDKNLSKIDPDASEALLYNDTDDPNDEG